MKTILVPLTLILLSGILTDVSAQSTITMNEIYTRGVTGNRDWIELYNSAATPANLGGYKIYDIGGQGATKPKKAIPTGTIIAAKGFYVIITDTNSSASVADGFGLSNTGEPVWLEDSTGTIIDTINIPALGTDTSWARKPDGSTTFLKLSPVTRGSTNGGGTAVEEHEILVTSYALHQNYPNPFNPSTSIAFDMPMAGDVQLRVYDLVGREVARLVDGQQSPGRHSVTFNANGLTSGIYLCRLTTAQFSATTRLLLLK